jgi:hypothetical protein
MRKAIGNIEKKRGRGRPPTEAVPVMVRVMPAQIGALDSWISNQPEPQPSRPEAIRRLLANALGETPGHTVDDKIAIAERVIEDTPIPKKRTPQRGLAMLKRGKAEAALAGLKSSKGKS